jgi:hypothetical protein
VRAVLYVQVGKLRAQVSKLTDMEAHFTQLCFSRGKELDRVRAENDALLRRFDEMEQKTKPLEDLCDTQRRELESRRENDVALQREVACLEAALTAQSIRAAVDVETVRAEADARYSTAEAAHTHERERMQELMNMSFAAADEKENARRMRAMIEEERLKSAADSIALSEKMTNELKEKLAAAEEERNTLRVTAHHQRIAAKALGVMYALRIGLLRRKMARMGTAEGIGANEKLVKRNNELTAEIADARRERDEVQATQEDLEASLAFHRAQHRKEHEHASSLESKLRLVEHRLASTNEERNFLSTAMARAEAARAHATARHDKLAAGLAAAKREIATSAAERVERAADSAVLRHRVCIHGSRVAHPPHCCSRALPIC